MSKRQIKSWVIAVLVEMRRQTGEGATLMPGDVARACGVNTSLAKAALKELKNERKLRRCVDCGGYYLSEELLGRHLSGQG